MAKQLQLRRGTSAEHSTFTGAAGEVTIDTDKDVVVVHNGVTAGGFPMAKYGKDMAITVDTVADFPANPNNGDVVIVRDLDRGGTFIYDSSEVVGSNDGTNFNGWVRQYSGAVNVKWFGAKGDGVTDDTDAIQETVTFAAKNNLISNFPKGTYLISSTINLTPDISYMYAVVQLEGESSSQASMNMSSVLYTTTTLTDGIFKVVGNNPEADGGTNRKVGAIFKNLGFSNNGLKTALALHFYGVQAPYIEGCLFYGFLTGIKLHNVDLPKMYDNVFKYSTNGVLTSGTGYATSSGQINSFILKGNQFGQVDTCVDYVGGHNPVFIQNNLVGHNVGFRFSLTSESQHTTVNPIVRDNYFEGGTGTSIQIGGSNGVVFGGLIEGNRVLAGATETVIYVGNLLHSNTHMRIRNNKVSGVDDNTSYSLYNFFQNSQHPELDTSAFLKAMSTNIQSIASNTWTKIIFDYLPNGYKFHAPENSNGGSEPMWWDTTNSKLNIGVHGRYEITLNGFLINTQSSNDRFVWAVHKNGAEYRIFGGSSGGIPNEPLSTAVISLELFKGDYIEIYAISNVANNLDGGDNALGRSCLVEYIGAINKW